MYHYVKSFTNNGVGGKQLLNIRPYELEQLGMHVIGHQEIVLEAVENLKNFVSVPACANRPTSFGTCFTGIDKGRELNLCFIMW